MAHDWEDLVFSRGGSGEWSRGDRHGEDEHVRFEWKRDGTALIVTAGQERRTVRFEIERRRHSVLRFDAPPVAHASTEFHAADRGDAM